jgi:hypothetical protein
MSDLFCLDSVVFCVGANEANIDNLKLVLYGHDQPIRISLNVEYDTVIAKKARCTYEPFGPVNGYKFA